uniref:tyrosine-type recombinase/integrase n=1 Tax=Rheinheimera sp. TaxID=1869214 RepID=UPI004047D478
MNLLTTRRLTITIVKRRQDNYSDTAGIAPNRMSELLSTVHHSSVQEQTKNVILFQLSTMIRPYESVSAQWKDIDFTNKLWRIPADKMKMNRPHTVYLNAVALDILKQQKQVSGNSKFVFPNRVDPKRHMSSGTANAAISRMGFKDQLVAHGLRSLASTTMNEVGFNAHHIEASLSHVDENGVRKTYNNAVYITFRRDLSDWWGHWLIKCSNRLITPALPLLKYVFEEHPFKTSKLEGQNNDNQFMFSSSRLSAQQQVAMG